MALTSGSRLGRYEITGTLGAGGMGEVYRARDPELERDVAIKVLPASFAADTDRVARFEQEAKTLAALNHANIAQIYGIERTELGVRADQAGGGASAESSGVGSPETMALVMELVDGPTLADRIADGPLPPDEALGIAMQIADALEAAHERGIIHRDLKPANIKLRPDGAIKVLDFGIAKAAAPELADSGPSPIMTTPATQVGVILGTAAYMSPEQARGKAVDQRTDIWAFGCVLYEMLTGQLAFGGEDVAVTLARVIANDTDLDSLPATISPAVQRTIELCLRKDPRKRVADIRDVRLALAGEFTVGAPGAAEQELGGGVTKRGPGWAGLAAAALLTGITATAVTVFFLESGGPAPPRGTRFTVEVPQGETLGLDGQSQSLAISSDGGTIAFSTLVSNNRYDWHLRRVDALDARRLRGSREGFETPFFSPDGRWIAFDDGELWRLPVLGGTPTRIATPDGRLRGASWGENDEIVFSAEGGGLWVVAADGGEPRQLTDPESGGRHRWPSWLPGNRAAVFALQRGRSSQIAVVERESGSVRVLIPDGLSPTWLDSGHLVYGIADGSLRAVRFDVESLSIIGDPVPVGGIGSEPIAMTGATMGMHYAVAADGTLIYGTRAGGPTVGTGILPYLPGWLSSEDDFVPLAIDSCFCLRPAISPDGTSVAMTILGDPDTDPVARDIWVLSLERNTLRRLTFDSGSQGRAVWSPDSTRIAYRDFERGISIRRADGTGDIETIEVDAEVHSWAPDNRLLLERTGGGGADIAVIEATPGAEPVELLASPTAEQRPVISPDGRWLAYASSETGLEEVFVRPYPDVDGGQWQISVGGGFNAAWSSDSSHLYFENEDALMVTEIETEPAFSHSTPRPVVDMDGYSQAGFNFAFAVEPGTDRILVAMPVGGTGGVSSGDPAPSRLVVIQDFDELIRQLLPVE